MLDMDELPCLVDGPIRSRFRGLSWDKKHRGWRVRIFYRGKQRHVGRYEDDVTAAKAYDTAAVYLYGANAITNFGVSQVAEDPVEVSAFIVLAKEQVDQEQASRSQHRLHDCTADSRMVKAAQQLLPISSALPEHLLVNCSSYSSVPQTPAYPQLQLPLMGDDSLACQWQQQQQQLYGVNNMQGITPQQQQQQQQAWSLPPGLDQPAVMMAPPDAVMDPLSSSISTASSACTMSAAAAGSATSNTSSPVSAVGSSSSYIMCTTPGGQHVLVPISAAVGDVAGPMPAVYSGIEASVLMSQQQLQAQQLLAARQHLGHSMVAQTQQQQQQQQHNVLLISNTAAGQPVQLSVQPQLTTIAGHMAAAQVPGAHQQLAMSVPMASPPSWSPCNNSMPAVSAAAGADSAAGALVNMPATSAGPLLIQTTSTSNNIHRAAMFAGSAAAPVTHATSDFVGVMLRGLDCYTPAAANAAAADCHANQVAPTQQQQLLLVQQVLLGSSRAASDGIAHCSSSSSSCSPMFGVQRMLLETSTVAPSPSYGLLGQLGNHNHMSVMKTRGASFAAAQMVCSPTLRNGSNGSSNSQSYGANVHVMY